MPDVLLAVEVGNWEKIDVWVAGIAAFLLVAVLIVTSITAMAAVGAAKEARRANDAAAVERGLRLRPWVGIGSLQASRIIHEDGSVTLAGRGHLTTSKEISDADVIGYSFSLTNYGQSPALRVGIAQEYARDLAGIRVFYSDPDEKIWVAESIMKIEEGYVRTIRQQTYESDGE
jgi:hypothetical protein